MGYVEASRMESHLFHRHFITEQHTIKGMLLILWLFMFSDSLVKSNSNQWTTERKWKMFSSSTHTHAHWSYYLCELQYFYWFLYNCSWIMLPLQILTEGKSYTQRAFQITIGKETGIYFVRTKWQMQRDEKRAASTHRMLHTTDSHSTVARS